MKWIKKPKRDMNLLYRLMLSVWLIVVGLIILWGTRYEVHFQVVRKNGAKLEAPKPRVIQEKDMVYCYDSMGRFAGWAEKARIHQTRALPKRVLSDM